MMHIQKDVFTSLVNLLNAVDKMPDNPDLLALPQYLRQQVEVENMICISVFVCPKFNTAALFSDAPEEYMPIVVDNNDLFAQRILKIKKLLVDIKNIGLNTCLNIILGDNDAEEYIFPFLPELQINFDLLRSRQLEYAKSFDVRAASLFGQEVCIYSLADCGVVKDQFNVGIVKPALEKELIFFKWLFSDIGPYKGNLIFNDSQILQMIDLKYKLYGAQGRFLEYLRGILLQTEGPGVWLERTNMLKCTGSNAIPAIYPWIRKEELASLATEQATFDAYASPKVK